MSPEDLHCTAHVTWEIEADYQAAWAQQSGDQLTTNWLYWNGAWAALSVMLPKCASMLYDVANAGPYISLAKATDMKGSMWAL